MKNNIRAVIFDLGNVLIDFNHLIAAQKISRFTEKSPQEIFGLFFDSDITRTFEEGKISPEDFFGQVKKMLSLEVDYSKFLHIWNEIFFSTDENKQVYDLAKSLKDTYKTVLLSNVNILHFEYLKKNFPVFDAFDYVLTSYELGLVKPNPLIYKKTLELIGICAEEVFYIDDRFELVQEAAKLGIKGHTYRGFAQLKHDLLVNGISLSRRNHEDV